MLTEVETVDNTFLNDAFDGLNENIYLKVDVEGCELIVLTEIFKTEKANLICCVFFEVDTRWVNPVDSETLLKKYGFLNFKKIRSSKTCYDVLATKV